MRHPSRTRPNKTVGRRTHAPDPLSPQGGTKRDMEDWRRALGGVPIPFASPRLLWRMKAVTHRAKDAPDLVFLRHWFEQQGETPPEVGRGAS